MFSLIYLVCRFLDDEDYRESLNTKHFVLSDAEDPLTLAMKIIDVIEQMYSYVSEVLLILQIYNLYCFFNLLRFFRMGGSSIISH